MKVIQYYLKFLSWIAGHPVKGQTVYFEQKSPFWTSQKKGIAKITEVRDSDYRYRYKVIDSKGEIDHLALEDIERVFDD